jgi:transcriptional regulator NrdR family protein
MIPCPLCGVVGRVLDTRWVEGMSALRRRRECSNGHRFTTHETITNSLSGVRESDIVDQLNKERGNIDSASELENHRIPKRTQGREASKLTTLGRGRGKGEGAA